MPDDIGYSDDLLNTLSYMSFYASVAQQPAVIPAALLQAVNASYERTNGITVRERSSFFNFAYAAAAGVKASPALAAAVMDLQQWPLSLVDW